ncbi:unnamed protein product [Adineta steineri]|uniref:VCBS repeat-containing protein n=1 Tax=Adineta steineri TaxID=433720 RepID=A0A813Q4L4_9BILA|nr:unnamed protein product [Adineta steineri]CAF0797466.1 unnamed protein product [Adineta steineri]
MEVSTIKELVNTDLNEKRIHNLRSNTKRTLENTKISKRKYFLKRIGYSIIGLIVIGAMLSPVLYTLLKNSSTDVSEPEISKPVTSPILTKTTRKVTVSTTTAPPFDQCTREYSVLTKDTGSFISSVMTADLNNDNKIDIIFIQESYIFVSILFNLGNNKFTDKKLYELQQFVLSLATGDINDDGYVDIIVGQSYSTIAILWNDGHGIFNDIWYSPSEHFITTIYSIAIADINNDEKYDIIVTGSSGIQLSIFYNKGNKIFRDVIIYPAGNQPMSVTVADLNDDNKLEIIIAYARTNTIGIHFDNGNGDFSKQITYSVGYGPIYVTAGNINNDTKLDIIVVNFFSNKINILLNNNGIFNNQTILSNMVNPVSVALTDYNNDGTNDIIVPNFHSNYVSVFFNDGYGTFSIPVNYTTYPSPRCASIADLNDDKKSDIIIGTEKYIGVIITECD